MTSHAGLDVAEQATRVCVVDAAGEVVLRGVCRIEPGALHRLLAERAPGLGRAVLETGALAAWLVHGLRALGVPVVCACARQAQAALQHGPSKTDRSDALGLARLAQIGWLKQVHARGLASHEAKSLVVARGGPWAPPAAHRCADGAGACCAPASPHEAGLGQPDPRPAQGVRHPGRQARRRPVRRPGPRARRRPAAAAGGPRPALDHPPACPGEIEPLDGHFLGSAKEDAACRRLMTVPGVAHLTARTFMAVIDDPGRSRSSQDIGAYLGLVPRRWQSGQLDQAGRITRCGDGLLRHLLHECANNILNILKKPCGLKDWASRLEARVGARKARVALARRLAVLMHRLWTTGEAYDWSVCRSPPDPSRPPPRPTFGRSASVVPPGRGPGEARVRVLRRQAAAGRPRRGPCAHRPLDHQAAATALRAPPNAGRPPRGQP